MTLLCISETRKAVMIMREILFRGKRIDSGEWVEGGYYVKKVGDYITAAFIVENLTDEVNEAHRVLPETIGQSTGLCDKNGKKIFEGDIVTTDIARPYLIVEFRDGCFMFNCNDGGEDYYDIMLPICKEPHKEYEYGEVIGNIHDAERRKQCVRG